MVGASNYRNVENKQCEEHGIIIQAWTWSSGEIAGQYIIKIVVQISVITVVLALRTWWHFFFSDRRKRWWRESWKWWHQACVARRDNFFFDWSIYFIIFFYYDVQYQKNSVKMVSWSDISSRWYQSETVSGCRLWQWWAKLKIEKTDSIKMEINRFDEKSNFSLWQTRMKDVLIQ